MKIALKYSSLLVGKALEYYLQDYLCDEKDAEFIVTDKIIETNLPIFLISKESGANLKVPFTKKMLFDELESFYINCVKNRDLDSSLDEFVKDIKKKERARLDKIIKSYNV